MLPSLEEALEEVLGLALYPPCLLQRDAQFMGEAIRAAWIAMV